jgi:N-hydroxyarylamine O-acetyltransferase
MPDLGEYLRRVGVDGDLTADLAGLTRLHRAHLSRISYENLDIHFGRTLSLDLGHIYRKIVIDGRGGWCFEMNTLFRWVLEQAGFRVTLIRGTAAHEGDHMLLCVEIDGNRYLADMGWGNGFFDPLPLVVGTHLQGHRRFEIAQNGASWRFSNMDHGDDGFTFSLTPRVQDSFAERACWLQTDPASSFVRVVKGFRFDASGTLHMLRGAVLSTLDAQGKSTREVQSATDYESVWRDTFRTPLTNVASLWPKVHADHIKWAEGKARS